MSTPHTWSDIINALQEHDRPESRSVTEFMLELVRHIEHRGYMKWLSPMFSVGRIFIFPNDPNNDLHIVLNPPTSDSLGQFELIRGSGSESVEVRHEQVTEENCIAVLDEFIKTVRSQTPNVA